MIIYSQRGEKDGQIQAQFRKETENTGNQMLKHSPKIYMSAQAHQNI